MSDDQELFAGDFSAWLEEAEGAIRRGEASDVPCDGLHGVLPVVAVHPHRARRGRRPGPHAGRRCCSPRPGCRAGHVLMGYDERGHCPMLVDDACSIYEHRPADLSHLRLPGLRRHGRGARRRSAPHRRAHGPLAVRPPGRVGRGPPRCGRAPLRRTSVRTATTSRPATVPGNPTQLAVLAIDVHDVFLGGGDRARRPVVVQPELATVRDALLDRARGSASRDADA